MQTFSQHKQEVAGFASPSALDSVVALVVSCIRCRSVQRCQAERSVVEAMSSRFILAAPRSGTLRMATAKVYQTTHR